MHLSYGRGAVMYLFSEFFFSVCLDPFAATTKTSIDKFIYLHLMFSVILSKNRHNHFSHTVYIQPHSQKIKLCVRSIQAKKQQKNKRKNTETLSSTVHTLTQNVYSKKNYVKIESVRKFAVAPVITYIPRFS